MKCSNLVSSGISNPDTYVLSCMETIYSCRNMKDKSLFLKMSLKVFWFLYLKKPKYLASKGSCNIILENRCYQTKSHTIIVPRFEKTELFRKAILGTSK